MLGAVVRLVKDCVINRAAGSISRPGRREEAESAILVKP